MGEDSMEAQKEAQKAGRFLNDNNSGSDSWDPLQGDKQVDQEGSQFSSQDADSRAQPVGDLGGDKGTTHQGANDEDMDLGGEGGASLQKSLPVHHSYGKERGDEGLEEGPKNVKLELNKEDGVESQRGEKEVIVISDDSEGGTKGKEGAVTASRGTTGSVPPGYQRRMGTRATTQVGGASPFGKLQRGGFRFLKRSSSGASSGARAAPTGPAKKTKPISSLPADTIGEVARNVGVAQPLTEEQIALLRSLEEKRASK